MSLPMHRREVIIYALLLALLSASSGTLHAQIIQNGSFGSGTSGWDDCNAEVGLSVLYGGGSFVNRVASVNAGLNPLSTHDDNVLCQTISGFTVGSVYAVTLNATRCQILGTPATVSSFITIDAGVETQISRSGGWSMTPSMFLFTAASTTHELVIRPGQLGLLGMIFDDIQLTLVSSLPVELLYFNAEPSVEGVHLEWATASEHLNSHFTVERSADGDSFEAVCEVPGAGTSHSTVQYAARDGAPMHGTSFYRLKQTDLDGSVTYSRIVVVEHIGAGQWLTATPDHFLVLGEPAGQSLEVYNLRGELVHSTTVHAQRVQRPYLASGAYIAALTDHVTGERHTCRFALE